MSTNLYFLISNQNNSFQILNGPDYLPVNFLNVSNFNALEQSNPDFVRSLDWIGRPDLGFWQAVLGPKPEPAFAKQIISQNTINESNYTVSVAYSEIELTPEQQEQKKESLKFRYVPSRDNYLRLTDFTQLSDAPITEQAKEDFRVFRQQLRAMFNITDYSLLAWPPVPTSAPNIILPPLPPIDFS